MKILLVEDDEKIISFLKKGLEEEYYTIDFAINGDDGIYLATTNKYDLILLDVMLPIKDGIEVCKILRDEHITIPIIMITAKDSLEDKIRGLDIGANDYITKPFAFDELLARIRVQLRIKEKQNNILKIDTLELNLITKRAVRDNVNISLTAKEFALLYLLMSHENEVLNETMISETLSSMDDIVVSNVVNVYIYRLRNKIDKPFDKKLIKTVRGLGFKINDE